MPLWDDAQSLKRLYRRLYVLVALLGLAAAGFWLVHSSYFPVKTVRLAEPARHVTAAQISDIVRGHLRGNIFTADVGGARKALLQLPWVADAKVTRLWPDTVELTLREREAVARRIDGRLVDSTGKTFKAGYTGVLPVLDGPDSSIGLMTAELADFQKILKPTGLRITYMTQSGRLSRSLVLDNGVVVYLGRHDAAARLQQFVRVWPGILKPQAEILESVDMRYKDGFAVREKKGGRQQAPATVQAEENQH